MLMMVGAQRKPRCCCDVQQLPAYRGTGSCRGSYRCCASEQLNDMGHALHLGSTLNSGDLTEACNVCLLVQHVTWGVWHLRLSKMRPMWPSMLAWSLSHERSLLASSAFCTRRMKCCSRSAAIAAGCCHSPYRGLLVSLTPAAALVVARAAVYSGGQCKATKHYP